MSKKMILWVEDEPELQAIRVRKLKRELGDIEILFARNPVEAIRELDSNKGNIVGVILDLMLPLGDGTSGQSTFRSGIELAKNICDKYPSMKIVVLTNLSKYTHTGKQIWDELENISCVIEMLEKTASISRFVNAVVETFEIKS